MSKTITSTKQSLIQLTESIQVRDVITFQINSESLNQNFLIVKQCLLKVQQLQNEMGKEKSQKDSFNKMFASLQAKVKDNQKSIQQHDSKIKQLQSNVSDDFMKKFKDLEDKSKNMYNFDETIKKLQEMDLFVSKNKFNEQQNKLSDINKQLSQLKDELNRYVSNRTFEQYKNSTENDLAQIRDQIQKLNQNNSSINLSIEKVATQCNKAFQQVEQNSKMLKEMNFTQLMDKIKKMKEDLDQKIGQFSLKLKKKCGINDLNELQNNIIQKLDKFFAQNQKGKASLNQTKDALMYLERRLNEIYEILGAKTDEENDALFSAKKIHCASCTKDLGKFEGKLGQYRPWAVFPCKQLDPEKAGGLGYLTYVDKMHYRRGSIPDQSSLERLNKTFNEKFKQDESPKKSNTARSTNYMSSFGEETRKSFSLKDQYFKEIRNDKTAGNRFFRVKKDSMKPSTALESVKEKVKQV